MVNHNTFMENLLRTLPKREEVEEQPTEAQRVRWAEMEVERKAARAAAQERADDKWPCHPHRAAGWREDYCRECGGAMDDGSTQEIAQQARDLDRQWNGRK